MLRRGLLWPGLAAALAAAATLGPIRFRDVAAEAGVTFVLEHNPTPAKHMIETMPGGLAIFDYDGDGRLDLYFTNGAAIPAMEKTPEHANRLYRNLGKMRFEDVTEAAGVAGAGYSMGAAAADYDNDGHIDLFVAGVQRNTLYRNLGDGRFEDVTEAAGIHSRDWAVAAGWFDYDNDGLLDLLVVNYAEWSLDFDRYCGDRQRNLRVYCHPKYFEPIANTLYRNRGDGTFEDATAGSGIGEHAGRGMSAAFADYDGDGWIDAFVTNDNLPNFLFRNRGDGTFEETALLAGAALLDHGKPVASMGADFRDYDNDGRPDLTVTALTGETFPLFRNTGGEFEDATHASHLARLTNPWSGWGNGFFDFDNDGWKDLFTANSHVNDLAHLFESAEYKQPNRVFRNTGQGGFEDVSASAGEGFASARAHRGIGFGDLDGDGRIDAVVSALGERAEIWRNESGGGHGWLIVKLEGTRSNRDGIGAVLRADSQWNLMTTAVGYASSSHSGVHFGLGAKPRVDRLEIRWPGGARQVLENVPANQVLEVREPR